MNYGRIVLAWSAFKKNYCGWTQGRHKGKEEMAVWIWKDRPALVVINKILLGVSSSHHQLRATTNTGATFSTRKLLKMAHQTGCEIAFHEALEQRQWQWR
jgi:hypothetical protein